MTDQPLSVQVADANLQMKIERHRAFWERAGEGSFLRSAGVFSPSSPVALPQRDGRRLTQADPLTPDMIDPDLMIDELEALDEDKLDSTLPAQGQYLVSAGLGDLLPLSRPFSKIPWIEAMLGCPLLMTEGQIWNEHYPGDPEELLGRPLNIEQNPWFQLYLEFLRRLQDRLGERFPVSANTLFRGTSDLSAAILGVAEACIGWLDRPAFMARLMRLCTDAVITVIQAGYEELEPFQGGYVIGGAIWAPRPTVWTQADHSTLISALMYEKQVLPYDIEVIRSCPMSVFHLHNSGLHIAPLLIQVSELTAIEVAIDPYPTPERKGYEVEMLQLIQTKKPLILDGSFPSLEEAEWLLGQLDRNGLCFNPRWEPALFESLPAGMPGSQSWLL